MNIVFLPKRRWALAFAAQALAALVAAAPAAAQTMGAAATPETSSTSSSQSTDSAARIAHFVKSAIPNTNFIATASRMAISNSHNSKILKLAESLAKDQNAVAISLTAWVNVSTAVVTRRSPYTGQIGPGTDKLKAPRFLPSQVDDLQRLSALQGSNFDSLFVSTQMAALVQLQTLYSDFIQNSADPGLLAIATRQLPKVEQAISAFDSL